MLYGYGGGMVQRGGNLTYPQIRVFLRISASLSKKCTKKQIQIEKQKKHEISVEEVSTEQKRIQSLVLEWRNHSPTQRMITVIAETPLGSEDTSG